MMNGKSVSPFCRELNDELDLLGDTREFYKRANGRNHHIFDHVNAAGECRLIRLIRLFFGVVPNLAVGAVAIPAKIAVRNRLEGKILKATQQAILFRHFNALAQHFNRHKSVVRIK